MISLKRLFYIGFLVSMGIYYLRIYMKGDLCHLTDRIDGKIVLITGANTGIGLETAVELAARGGIVHMACRDSERCRLAKVAVKSRAGVNDDKVFTHSLDLASLKSIMLFSKTFEKSVDRLDILINNAGIMMCPYQESEDGFEMQLGVNHLGHFLLTNQLLELIKKGHSPRIIIVSSRGHIRGSINTTDFNLRGDDYGPLAAYSQSKLANVLHAKALANRVKKDGVAVVSLHPGVVHTELSRHLPRILQFIGTIAAPLLIKTPMKGAQTQICCAVNPHLYQHTGTYFSDCKPTESTNPQSHNESLVELLWDQSEKAIKAKLDKIV